MKRIFQNFGKVVLAIALVAAAGCRKEDTLRFLPGENGEPSDYEVVDAAVNASAEPSGIYLVNQGNQGSDAVHILAQRIEPAADGLQIPAERRSHSEMNGKNMRDLTPLNR